MLQGKTAESHRMGTEYKPNNYGIFTHCQTGGTHQCSERLPHFTDKGYDICTCKCHAEKPKTSA
jgi:muconolactone delta-isomerase